MIAEPIGIYILLKKVCAVVGMELMYDFVPEGGTESQTFVASTGNLNIVAEEVYENLN